MPRSSRHKSHKQSKNSSKEAKDSYSDEDEDVKMKERNSNKEDGGGSVKVSKDSSHSGEKRKLASSSLLKDGKDGKDLRGNGNGNGDGMEEYVSTKRRKDKANCGGGGAGDRWNDGGDDKDDVGVIEKETLKIDSEKGAKSKGLGESKSRSSKRHDNSGEKEEKNVGSLVEKEENRRGDSKRKSEKESGRKEGKESKEVKEKDRGSDKEKKGQESKRDSEVRLVDGISLKKQGSQSEDAVEDRQGKRGRENTELRVLDDVRNSELEKDHEKRVRRRRDGSDDRDRSQDARESDERHTASRGERAKDGRYKDERYKDGSYGDKNQDDVEKDDRHRDVEKDERHRDIKYREDADKDIKYREDVDRDTRHRDDKYSEDGEKDSRRREDKYREDSGRDTRHKDGKYRDDGDRDSRRRDDKYRVGGDKDNRRIDDRHYEDGERDNRHRDDKHRDDSDRYKEEKRQEDYERDSRHRDGKQGDDVDREKKLREAKCKDERAPRDHSGDKSDVKHSREEIHAADLHSRKSSMRDSSPNYDDRARLKDDQGRKRNLDKDDQGDIKTRSSKDRRYELEKRSTTNARVDLISDRGRSTSRNADLELTPNRSRHQGSPSSSSHVTRDHFRISKQDDSKYREYAYEERARNSVTSTRDYASAAADKNSSSRLIEKSFQKGESHLVELSAERRLRTDAHARTSPRQLFDKSPISSTDRRYVSRSDVRWSIDVEESGQRSGGSRDAKDYSGKEGRGNRDLAMETLQGDELSQADGDNLSVSSPFARSGHLSGNSKSLLPHPFRTGVDSPLNFGSSEDDNRMKFNNRHRRISDPNMGRVPGSPWKGVPSWPSPMANGFMPFQHGPPPVGFHPVMQQFPAPPIFGVRPPMDLNHPGVPYHIPDAERFTGHGRPMTWRNPVDDSCPSLHGWDANNAPFGEEPHIYGRPDWDHSRTQPGSRGWESSGDMWKGPKSDASMELVFASEKEGRFTPVSVDVALAGQSGQQAQDEQQPDHPAESISTSQSSDALEKRTLENPKLSPTEALTGRKNSEKDDVDLCHVYLSKLDISGDLTDPELYSKCTGLIDVDEKIISDAEDCKILYVEDAAEAKEKHSRSDSGTLLFATINDFVFQKAMTLYKKRREEFVVISGENTTLSKLCNKGALKSDQEIHLSDNNKAEQLLPAGDEVRSEDGFPNCNEEVKQPVSLPKLEEVSAEHYQKLDDPIDDDSEERSGKIMNNIIMKEELVTDLEFQDQVLGNSVSMKDVESSVVLPTSVEDAIVPGNSKGLASNSEEETMTDTKCGSLLLSDVSSKACEVVMPERIESGSVNLSRIHHSPENTH